MPTHIRRLMVRLLLVLPIWALGTALAALVFNLFEDPQHRDFGLLISVRLVLAVFLPLLAIDRLWRVGVELEVAITAAILISASFPVLFFGGMFGAGIINPTVQLVGMVLRIREPNSIIPAMMIASAAGARFVAAALRKMTGRSDPILRRAMWIWGACWPLLLYLYPPVGRHDAERELTWLFARGHTWLGPFSILAWQVPISLACAIWFLRAAPASTPRPAAAAA